MSRSSWTLRVVWTSQSTWASEFAETAIGCHRYYYNSETMKMKMLLATIHGSSVRRMTSSKVSEPLYVSANTRVQKVAGALAQRVRANQQAFCAAMGPVAVAISLKCVYLANRFLLEDSLLVKRLGCETLGRGCGSACRLSLRIRIKAEASCACTSCPSSGCDAGPAVLLPWQAAHWGLWRPTEQRRLCQASMSRDDPRDARALRRALRV